MPGDDVLQQGPLPVVSLEHLLRGGGGRGGADGDGGFQLPPHYETHLQDSVR